MKLFARIQHKPWSCLLDSCEQTQMNARFDIVVSDPCITYEFIEQQHIINGPAKQDFTLAKTHCPFEQLANLHEQFVANIDSSKIEMESYAHLPFIVGALGAFGYDVNVYTHDILDAKPRQYAMADISIGFYNSALVYDNLTQQAYIFTSSAEAASRYQALFCEINTATMDEESPFVITKDWLSNVSQHAYKEHFNKIQDYLRAGDCYQVNYAQRFEAQYTGNEFLAYQTLKQQNKAPYSAFVRLPNSCLLSMSPERLLSVHNRIVETKPIKGTRKRSTDPEKDALLAQALLKSDKDQAENLMIVDLLRNDLSKHCEAHSVKVPKLFALESYPAVHHMVSTIVGKLKVNASVYDLLKGAFPGGSITGAPKVRAMQIIQALEADKRAIYCGSIGYIGIRNDMDTNICIRTLLAENQHIYCWAGGGIVIDSEANDEYQESLHKVAKILPYLTSHSRYE